MDGNVKIVRCPKCGSTRLTGNYEDQSKKQVWKILFLGIWGLISALRAKNRNQAYWQCLDCGTTFPME